MSTEQWRCDCVTPSHPRGSTFSSPACSYCERVEPTAPSGLPYRYTVLLEVEICGDGLHSDGDGAKATADRLCDLVETDRNVVVASRWPGITYGRRNQR